MMAVIIWFMQSWNKNNFFILTKKFVESRNGTPDINFWKSFYKYNQRSGGELASGFILLLFPSHLNQLLGDSDISKLTTKSNYLR